MHRQHRLGRVQRSLRWLLVTAPLALALGAEDGCSSTATPPAETIGTTSQAESIDSFGLGEGRSGALSVTVAGTVVNTYAEILTTSASQVTVGPLQGASAPFAPGDLVMIWRTTGLTAVTTSQAVFNLGTDVAGYEFGRVKSVSGSTLTFTNPLGSVSRYATGSQVIRVPEYTTVTIAAGAGVVPYAWDGTCGGAVVFLATGAVTSDGSVAADSAGFRGGGLENATSVVVAPGCTAHDGSDESASCGGAHKGEGLDPAAYALPVVPSGGDMLATYGNGNYANGGGGGEARNAGGGGGGHFGLGGTGGDTALLDGSRAVGGYGGAPLSYVPGSGFVSLGGGGGAGDEDHGTGTPGGSGGGVVFIRAASIAGTGTFTAQGATIAGTAGTDGSGGGGAGGAVFLFSAGAVACTIASANGGAGGSGGSEPDGPGGGGGGGVVYIVSSSTLCSVTADGGANGKTDAASMPGAAYGATAGQAGQVNPGGDGAYGNGACTPALLAANLCGGCVADADCPASQVCDTTKNSCGPCTATEQGSCTGTTSACSTTGTANVCVACNGNLGSTTATAPCLAASAPKCVTSGASAGTCAACLTGADCTTAAAPACSTATFACTACDGDQGTTATATCPSSAAPYCQAAGTCGVCTSDADCGAGHAGPRCDMATGACGSTCTTDAICGAGHWCDNLGDAGVGVCQAQVANGGAVPGGSCTPALAVRACVAGVCDTTDGECGIPDGGACASADGGQSASACRSGACATTGPNAGKCEACSIDADCSGATPACSPTTNTCVACTASNSAACTGDTPVCDVSAGTCAACSADRGTSGGTPCATSSAPYCFATGACGKCANNSDCSGAGHPGPVCDVATGACGNVCGGASDCGADDYCDAQDGGTGTCRSLVPNGGPLPSSPASLSVCTQAVGALVCASGVCNARNTCGPLTDAGTGDASVIFPPDASIAEAGVSIEGGALSCDVRGPLSSRSSRSSGETAGLSALALALAAACRRSRRRSRGGAGVADGDAS